MQRIVAGNSLFVLFQGRCQKGRFAWQNGYIADAGDNFATIRRNRDERGRGLKIVLEDI
jgi:hypothetical protein